ncbi:MAG: mandelate racemase/muconate lactonizing enzyme family protein [Rhodobacteraceae bacterium]|nr:mandelate racemase/muconate lactonizing enzyme family protein [Paracoccaceae bacterium]
MQVDGIESFVLRYPDANDHGSQRMTVLVRVRTAEGLSGWGEAIAMWPEACSAVAAIVAGGLQPVLRAAGPTDVAAAWEAMRAHAWWYGEGGIASMAIAAVDMALWDIAGQQAGQPLWRLFGRRAHDALPACASCHVNKPTLAANVAEVEGFFARGFRSVKLGLGKRGPSPIGQDPEMAVRFVAMLRAALGPAAEILVDVGNGIRWDRDTGITVARRLADLGVGWIEEPFYPTRTDDYRALKAAVPIAVATGEREYTVTGYDRLIATGTVDVVGVDPARAEGITGFRAVDRLVQARGLTINAHAWSTAVTTAASLHLSVASPAARLFELKPHPVVVQDDLVDRPVVMRDGVVAPHDAPGLGIRVDETVVRRLAVG